MKKEISSEFAIGMIVVTSIIFGGIFLLLEKRQDLENTYYTKNFDEKEIPIIKKNIISTDKDQRQQMAKCNPRYFEGESEIRAWFSREVENKISVRIKSEDLKKLPTNNVDLKNENFTATLVDPTEEIKDQLENSGEDNPVVLKIKGYARACQNEPEISLSEATKVFKKS